MKAKDPVERFVAETRVELNAERDTEVLGNILEVHRNFGQRQAEQRLHETWRTIMNRNKARVAAAVVVVAVILFGIAISNRTTRPTFAISHAIETLKEYPAVRLEGAVPGGTFEVWMRANRHLTWSTDAVFRDSRGTIAWTKDGSTYQYEPSQHTIHIEYAITVGARPWLGPELLEALNEAAGAQLLMGTDPATGGDRATFRSALTTADGPKSFVIEFDVATKLPVSMKQWGNLEYSGPPAVDVARITYFKELPDSVFDVRIPGSPTTVEKSPAIPEANLDLIADPAAGIPVGGMTRQEACEALLRSVYESVIAGDLGPLRQLAPLAAKVDDGVLQAMILREGRGDRIVELLRIGRIAATGHNRLGPVEAVPVTVRLQNGATVEEKILVQFRQIEGRQSCVFHGPYGFPREIE
jgi:hypothetical protein